MNPSQVISCRRVFTVFVFGVLRFASHFFVSLSLSLSPSSSSSSTSMKASEGAFDHRALSFGRQNGKNSLFGLLLAPAVPGAVNRWQLSSYGAERASLASVCVHTSAPKRTMKSVRRFMILLLAFASSAKQRLQVTIAFLLKHSMPKEGQRLGS